MDRNTVRKKAAALLHDTGICILIGLMIAGILSVLLALISGVGNGFAAAAMLNTVRSGLLLTGAILLFVTAGVLLSRKSNEKISSMSRWRETFFVFGAAPVFFVLSAAVLAAAVIADYIVWLFY